ncbi:hypothetical protein PpBr36_08203 [Pyricularia pennisetigena]|uniref:hypothetical protein n=1 Tax=Pyricularia pennisetigena TaxID=1578925 RepID=UPI0011502C5D|nr:hypothetical protein PpBr36_08203 [Pyricularia pennisetigena]TLS23911.1 hypothetical protein PpBr36_08203 [Pyricularia pennisetigena]
MAEQPPHREATRDEFTEAFNAQLLQIKVLLQSSDEPRLEPPASNISAARRLADQAVALSEAYPKLHAKAHLFLGHVLRADGRWLEAHQAYVRSAPVCLEVGRLTAQMIAAYNREVEEEKVQRRARKVRELTGESGEEKHEQAVVPEPESVLESSPKTSPGPPVLRRNWPKEIPYLNAPLRSPALTPAQLTAIRTPPSSSSTTRPSTVPPSFPRGPNPAVEIRPITDPRHPAHGQAGLFATRRLEPGSLILPYLGEIHPGAATATRDDQDEEYDYSKSDYDLWLSRDADVAVDAARCGNEARFVNDYRSVPGAERANAEFREVWDPRWRYRAAAAAAASAAAGGDVGGEGKGPPVMAAQAGEWGMALFVLPVGKKTLARKQQQQHQQQQNQGGSGKRGVRGIEKGEEILVSYGKGFWEKRREESGEAP